MRARVQLEPRVISAADLVGPFCTVVRHDHSARPIVQGVR